MYKVGILQRPNEADEEFDEIEDAEEAAITNSIDDGLWGVWDVETNTLISIAYAQILFSS